MKKENIVYLLFPLIFLFYFFMMKGHIGFWYESDWFLPGGGYFSQFVFKPGGWSEYIGYFILQFYKWPAAGAAVMTILPLGVFLLTRGIIRKLEIPSHWLIAGVLPFLTVCGMQCYMGMLLGEVLGVFFFYVFLWAYVILPDTRLRYVIASLFFPLAYLLLPTGGCVFLYITYIVYGFLYSKNPSRYWFMLFWALLLCVYPSLWQRWMYIMPGEQLYALVNLKSGSSFAGILAFLYGYGIILAGVAWAGMKMKKKGRRFFYLCEVALIAAGCAWGVLHCYQKNTEFQLRIDQAAEKGDWEQVLRLAGKLDQLSREEFYYVSLALASRGELGERLFDYPVWGLGCLYLPRNIDYQSSVMGGELYYRLKIPNEALHWTLQASVASPQGMNFRVLKRMADLSIQKGDMKVADKYLAILERTMLNDKWIKVRRAMMKSPQTMQVLPQDDIDFFIGGRPFLSDMARILDGGRSPEMTLDYILCGLLLNKDVNKFCQLFKYFYRVKDGQKIPKAYEEALLVAVTMGNQSVAGYPVSAERRKAYQDYNALFRNYSKNKSTAMAVMKDFKNTWWYYCHFVEPKLMDMQGNTLGEYQSH